MIQNLNLCQAQKNTILNSVRNGIHLNWLQQHGKSRMKGVCRYQNMVWPYQIVPLIPFILTQFRLNYHGDYLRLIRSTLLLWYIKTTSRPTNSALKKSCKCSWFCSFAWFVVSIMFLDLLRGHFGSKLRMQTLIFHVLL